MKIIIYLTLSITLLLATSKQYTNCTFQTEQYIGVCERAVKKGVSYEYANRFLLSFKASKRDFKSLKLFSPKKIATHRENEKRANNTLVKHVPEIVKHLKRYKTVYDHAEAKYGVNREVVAAILMKETRLGKIKPSHDAFIVFNTLLTELDPVSSRDHRLVRMAENNLLAIMEYCYAKKIRPNQCSFDSSYAGAVGIPQFMPQNFGHIEGYKKKTGSLSKMEDAIVSTSRFLHYNAKFKEMIEWSKIPTMEKVEEDWYDYDLEHDNASFAYAKSKKSGRRLKCFTCQDPDLAYLNDYVKKIMKY
ncbi:MAG: lytic murein transglycosylase, partial [Campylobacterota bacterium]|nr:lytic murein transglycosylase [Campylobacterota bacterium]